MRGLRSGDVSFLSSPITIGDAADLDLIERLGLTEAIQRRPRAQARSPRASRWRYEPSGRTAEMHGRSPNSGYCTASKEVGPELTEGVFAATDFWWTLEDKYPLAKMFVETFNKKYGYRPEWGAENTYMQFAIWARMVSEAGTSIRRQLSNSMRRARPSLPWSGTCISVPRIINWAAPSSSFVVRRRRI